MTISSAIYAEYFNSLGASVACPMCRRTDWQVPTAFFDNRQYDNGDIEPMYAALTIKTDNNEEADGRFAANLELLPFICTNCGYTRFHHTAKLRAWLAQRGGK